MLISRHWGMPSADTFDCPPIEGFVKKYLMKSKVSVDPFSRNKRWATHTNDLNPETLAEHHMEASDFLDLMVLNGVKADLVIFDPPYSLEQLKRSYESIGRDYTQEDGWLPGRWTKVKKGIDNILAENGIVLHHGWNSVGMGSQLEWQIEEIVLVCHGPGHNDTICLAERKLPVLQGQLFNGTACQPMNITSF